MTRLGQRPEARAGGQSLIARCAGDRDVAQGVPLTLATGSHAACVRENRLSPAAAESGASTGAQARAPERSGARSRGGRRGHAHSVTRAQTHTRKGRRGSSGERDTSARYISR